MEQVTISQDEYQRLLDPDEAARRANEAMYARQAAQARERDQKRFTQEVNVQGRRLEKLRVKLKKLQQLVADLSERIADDERILTEERPRVARRLAIEDRIAANRATIRQATFGAAGDGNIIDEARERQIDLDGSDWLCNLPGTIQRVNARLADARARLKELAG